jgi:hypothetical protein
LFDLALSAAMPAADVTALTRQIESQVEAWRQLAGRWESDVEIIEEDERVYAARSTNSSRRFPSLALTCQRPNASDTSRHTSSRRATCWPMRTF